MPRSRNTVLVALAALAAGVLVPGTASATVPLPPGTTYTLTVGPAGPNGYASDSPSSPFIDKDGTFYTQQSVSDYGASDTRAWGFDTGTNFDNASADSTLDTDNDNTTALCNDSPTGLEATDAPSGSSYAEANYCDLIGTWVDPDTGNWYGLVHDEFTPSPFGDGMHYDSIDYAESTNQGASWTIEGHALTSPYSTTRGDTTAFPNQTYYYGDGDPRLFVDPASGYFYVYYASSVIDKPGCAGAIQRLERVARAPISGKMATGSWQKWYNGSWSQPGIGGQESTIVPVDASNANGYDPVGSEYNPANTGCVSAQLAAGTIPAQSPLLYMNIAYDAYLGLYIAGANPENTSTVTAHPEQLFVTDNLATQKWTEVADTGSTLYQDYWYHWFVDTGNLSTGTIVGKTFRSYCDYGCSATGTSSSSTAGPSEYRDMTLASTTPAAAPVNLSDAYRITSGAGNTLTQVSGTSQTTSETAPTGSSAEDWVFTSLGDGSYQITNAGTGNALGVASTSTATRAWGTQPTATTANSADVGQQWFFVPTTDSNGNPLGSYRLVNRYSGLVLGLSDDNSTPLAETTPTRSWTDTISGSVGAARSAAEQELTFTSVGAAPTPDVALGKPATAESSQGANTPNLAVDNDPSDSSYWGADPAPQWWQVDLLGDYTLNDVAITNYVDGTRYYQYNIQASTDGSTWTTIATKSNDNVATSAGDSYPVSVTARYLRVNMTYDSANTGVHITDFKAFGTPVASADTDVAFNKPATAESSQGANTPNLAVDDDPSNNSYWGADPAPQWWQVDLGSNYNIDDVTITNYVDGVRYYQYNIQASTDGSTWTTIATKSNDNVATSAGDSYPVSVTARYLRVNMTSDSANTGVHIANFIAMGTPAS
ncbi:discoidin domain-containing protein [Actinospica durhamensis]|uniref:Discoidin domain-containing protein n=1 Tax=Actinospica durhamensis TaxID=1508375 RepID=A0A941EXF0_9ACTN|nr:discoidin domain-containing protein [Actinospica durhamensis]MBR7836769.1 discoidin domain-containing protein [Actinospica durhamensis]